MRTGDKKQSAIDEAIRGIREMICREEIQPGDRLPPERQLSEQLRVSRNTVREALHYFETVGIVCIKQGSGCYLTDNPDAMQKMLEERQLLERYNWMEMVQARRILECGIVRLAAERATREDKLFLREVQKNLIESSKDTDTVEGFSRHIGEDYKFHHAISEIAGNTILVELHSMMKNIILSASEAWEKVENPVDETNRVHQAIVDAIQRNDADDAAAAMDKHLDHMERLLQAARR